MIEMKYIFLYACLILQSLLYILKLAANCLIRTLILYIVFTIYTITIVLLLRNCSDIYFRRIHSGSKINIAW